MTEFVVNYTNGYMGSNDDILYSCNLPHIYSKVLKNNKNNARVLYKVTYYPGMRIADAYHKNDTSKLTDDEFRLYNIAINVIEQASYMTKLQAELFFHDTICKYVSYYTQAATKNMPRHATALGAFLDRKANCQGYCDAFYMLCSMHGFKVDMQSGIAGKQKHVWNVIELDGKWYAVDVTWDDNDANEKRKFNFISHKYFNASEDIMRVTHTWDEVNETEPIEKYIDTNYFYLTPEVDDFTFGYYFSTPRDALEFIGLALLKNKTSIRVMAKRTDKRYDEIKFVNLIIDSILTRARKAISYYTIVQRHGSYVYYSIEVKSKKK
ncbi:MAG: hypothetical protein K6G15_01775 [Desulfovibrio sp.]|nr:hypothetical protein [Desulfovibrio sp.]